MIHSLEYNFNSKFDTSMTSQSICLTEDVDSIESVCMLNSETGEIFELSEYKKEFDGTYSPYGCYQFTVDRFFLSVEKRLLMKFRIPKIGYTHALIQYKSRVMDRKVKCDYLLA